MEDMFSCACDTVFFFKISFLNFGVFLEIYDYSKETQ